MSAGRQIKIEILGSASGASAAFGALDSAAGKTEGVLGRVTGGLGKFGSAIGGAAKLAGGFVIAKAIYDAPQALLGMAQAAADDAASVGRLQTAVENSGASWGDYSGKINDAITQGQNLAFSDDDTRNALTLLTEETGSTSEAMARLHTAQDLARGGNIDLGTASKLLGKLTDENIGVLKRYGIQVDKNSTAQDVLNKVDARFGGQAAKFAESDAGKIARLKDKWGELQEQIGYFVLPILSAVTSVLLDDVVPALSIVADWVGNKVTAGWSALSGLLRGPTIAAFHAVLGAVGGFISYLRGDAIGGMNQMQAALNAVFGGETATSIVAWATLIADKVTGAIQIARDAFSTFKGALQGNWTNSDRINILSRIMGNLGLVIRSVVLPAWSLLRQGFQLAQPYFSRAWAVAGLLVRVYKDLAVIMAGPLISGLLGMLRGFGTDGLSGILPGLIEGLKRWGAAFLDLGSLAAQGFDLLRKGFEAVDWGKVGSTILSALGDALSGAGDLAGKLAGALGGAFDNIQWGDLASKVATGLGNAWGALTDAGSYVLSWITAGIGAIPWGDIPGMIASGIGTAWGALTDAGTYVYNWIVAGLSSIPWADIGSSVASGVGQAWGALTDAGTWLYNWISGGLGSVPWGDIAGQVTAGLSGALAGAQAGAGAAGGGIMSALLGAGIDIQPLLDQLSQLMTALQPVVDIVQTNLVAAWDSLKHSFDGVGVSLQGLQPMWEQLKPILETLGIIIGVALAAYVIALSAELRILAAIFAAVLIPAINIGIAALTSIFAAVNLVINVVKDVVKIATDLFHGDWSKAWQDAGKLVDDFKAGVVAILSGLPAVLGGYALDILNAIVNGLASLATDAGQKFLDLASSAGTALLGLVTDAGTKAGDILSGIVSGLADLPSKAGQFFLDLATGALSSLGGLVTDAGTKAVEIYTAVLSWFRTLKDDVITKAEELVSGVVDRLSSLPSDALSAIGDLSSTLYGKGTELIQGIANGIRDAIPNILSGALGAVGDALGSIDIPGFSPIPEAGPHMGQSLVGGIADGINMALPTLAGAVQGIGVSIGAGVSGLVAGGGGGGLLPVATAVGTTIGKAITAAIGIAITNTPVLAGGTGAGGGVNIGSIINSPALQALLPKLKDFGVSMIGKLSDGIAAGRLSMQGALDLLNGMVAASLTDLDTTNDLHVSDMITKLQDLASTYQGQLAQAMLDGTDPTQIKANLQAITALLDQYINTTAASVAETNASADAATALADAQQKLADKLQQVADNAQKATDALAANNLANGIGGPPSGTNTIGLPGTKIGGGGKGLLTNPGVLVAPTINYGSGNGASLTGANGQPFTRNNPLPVAVVAGNGGNSYTINAPDASPAAIRAALQLIDVRQAQQLAALGVG